MKTTYGRRTAGAAAVGAIALTLAACGGPTEGADSAGLSGTIAGSGASSQENAVQGWVAGFMENNPDASVTYAPTGSGTGVEQFLNSAVDFAGSDAALTPAELDAAEQRCGADVLELPLYISPIAVVYNIPGLNETHLNLQPETIAQIFAGEITEWNAPEIAQSNPEVDLPDMPIVPVNRSDDSGTTENFTEFLAEAADGAWPYEPSGLWPIQGTQSGSGTAGLLNVVQSAEGTIGYVDASRVGDLGSAAVGVGEEFVPFSPEAAAAVVDVSPATEEATDTVLTIDLDRDTEASGAYPIILVSYSIACQTYESDQTASMVQGYLDYIASAEGQERAARADVAGSAPISGELRTQVETAIDTISAAQ